MRLSVRQGGKMNISNVKQSLSLLSIFLLVSACAEYDVVENTNAVAENAKTVEVPAAAQKQTKEMAVAAIDEAKTMKKQAEELGGLWRDTSKLIKIAEASLKKNNTDKAYTFASMAKTQAEMAINQSYLEIANHKIGQVKSMIDTSDSRMVESINEAESAYLADNGQKAYALSVAMLEEVHSGSAMAKAMPKEMPEMKAETMAPASAEAPMEKAETMMEPAAVMIGESSQAQEMQMDDQYKVVSGDSLWGISKKPEIYNNPYQWPLIYKTNRDQINDPDMIIPGMVLAIDRAVSEAEINAAILHAKQRGSWALGEIESNDQAYINGDSMAAVN